MNIEHINVKTYNININQNFKYFDNSKGFVKNLKKLKLKFIENLEKIILEISNIIHKFEYKTISKILSKFGNLEEHGDLLIKNIKDIKILYYKTIEDSKAIIKDGIIFAKSHLDLPKLKLNYKENNILIVISEEAKSIKDVKFLRWGKDGWWINTSYEQFKTNSYNYIEKGFIQDKEVA